MHKNHILTLLAFLSLVLFGNPAFANGNGPCESPNPPFFCENGDNEGPGNGGGNGGGNGHGHGHNNGHGHGHENNHVAFGDINFDQDITTQQQQQQQQGQDNDVAVRVKDESVVKVDASDNSRQSIDNDFPVNSAAPVFAGNCAQGVSGQFASFGGSFASGNPVCDFVAVAGAYIAAGDRTTALEILKEAHGMSKWRATFSKIRGVFTLGLL